MTLDRVVGTCFLKEIMVESPYRKMSICIENDITTLSIEMVNKMGKSRKGKNTRSL
jgi:hypothetical protein